MHDLIHELLEKRGITTDEAKARFFSPEYERDMHDPFELPDMKVAVERILRAIEGNEMVAIYSDFDADGIPAGVVLHDVFKKIGHEKFINYIPHRDTEGYGFHVDAVDTLHAQEATLIITVDVGIVAHEAAAHAKDFGIDVIITDHHLPGETLPEALAVINPQRSDSTYPYNDLCGSGVAYKLVQALITTAREEQLPWVADIPEGWEKWLLDLVAIATVGDMMPLTGENRALVHFGLLVLRKSRRPGVGALCKKLGVPQAFLTEDDIGFSLAPRINASSRMGSPETAFLLLATTDEAQAATAAATLEKLNNQRKGAVAHMVKDLKKRFDKDHESDTVLVAGNPEWNPALLGLAANSIVDTFGKTTCLWGRDGTGALKGSCRSNGDVHIVKMFEALGDALTHYGGHEFAGGFAVNPDSIHTFAEACNSAVATLSTTAKRAEVVADASLPTQSLMQTYKELSALAPFGIENPKPLLAAHNMVVEEVRQFGKEDAHLELIGRYENIAGSVRAIAFFKHAASFTKEPRAGEQIVLVGTVECSRFAGRVRHELRIVDIV